MPSPRITNETVTLSGMRISYDKWITVQFTPPLEIERLRSVPWRGVFENTKSRAAVPDQDHLGGYRAYHEGVCRLWSSPSKESNSDVPTFGVVVYLSLSKTV